MPAQDKFRRHVRVREDIPVRWRVEQTGQEGQGIIRNLSISGILLESRNATRLSRGEEILLEAVVPEEASLVPREARSIWNRETYTHNKYYISGLEFHAPTPYHVRSIEKRIEERLHGVTGDLSMGVMNKYFGLQE